MKKHPELQQGSVQWLEARAGIVTASEAKLLLTDKLAIRKPGSEMPWTLLATKLAEKWLGPLPSFSAWATEQGQLLEESAIPAFEFEYGLKVERVGFITTDDGRCGCSPDGMLPDCGLEIKSLQPVHHVKCLMEGVLPEEFAAQVHFSMWVTGLQQWKLYLYSRRLPCLLLTIPVDAGVQGTIQQAVDSFLDSFEIEWQRLCEKNGGPPPPRKAFVPSDNDDPRKHLFAGLPGEHDHLHITP